jgi:putative NADH-flavin reductase
MKALVIGGTGGTGLATIKALLAGGHEVTALVRDASRLPALDGVRVVTGDVLDAGAVAEAVAGQDAVFVTLGMTRGRPTAADVCSAGTRHVVKAMQAAGVKRLLVVTTLGMGETRSQAPLLFRLVMATILKPQIADKAVQEAVVKASGLDWTLVRPVGLSSKPGTGDYVVDPARVRKMQVSREDVAAAMVALATGGGHIGEAVIVSG